MKYSNLVNLSIEKLVAQMLLLLTLPELKLTSAQDTAILPGLKQFSYAASYGDHRGSVAVRYPENYTAIQDMADGLIGLQDSKQRPCLLAEIKARLVVRQLGDKIFEKEKILEVPNVAMPRDVTVSGHCARNDNRNEKASLVVAWGTRGDSYRIEIQFGAEEVINEIKKLPEWRWEVTNVIFKFTPADNPDDPIVAVAKKKPAINAPLQQSFFCRDFLNVTLVGTNVNPVQMTLQLARNVRMQPYKVVEQGGFGNTYICQKSRERGLMESLRSRATIAMGVLLGIASVGTILGYGTKRQFFPSQQHYTTFT